MHDISTLSRVVFVILNSLNQNIGLIVNVNLVHIGLQQ